MILNTDYKHIQKQNQRHNNVVFPGFFFGGWGLVLYQKAYYLNKYRIKLHIVKSLRSIQKLNRSFTIAIKRFLKITNTRDTHVSGFCKWVLLLK